VTTTADRRLAWILQEAVLGRPPAVDGLTEVVPAPAGARAAIVAFTGHHVVSAEVDPDWVAGHCPPWALDAPFGPSFVAALAKRLGARPGTLDLVLVADGTSEVGLDLRPAAPEVTARALHDAPNPRRDSAVWQTPEGDGRVVLGRGLADRWEAAIEVAEVARGRGLGRRLAVAARGLVGPGEVVFAQIAPGNVASVRAALAAGYRPIAAEILFFD
jgi:hypothetical protein